MTDSVWCAPRPTRRQWLLTAASAALLPTARAAAPGHATSLLAAWQAGNGYHVGLVDVSAHSWSLKQSLTVPTRTHALLAEAGGSVLAVARRPGDWLLRWYPGTGQQQWHWMGEDRRFNGHVISSADHATLWTSETDLDTAQGRIGMRHAGSLEKVADWASHGMDPHELLALPERVGALPAGTLMVANGGIATLPETGRSKRDLEHMDSSLVALSPVDGALLGQWRLIDTRLSIRHLAWDAVGQRLGVALQAEHDSANDKARAPVLAIWDGERISPSPNSPPLQGYGGAVAACPGGGFLVGCPRAHTLAVFDAEARWQHSSPLPDACSVAALGEQWWAGGSTGVLRADSSGPADLLERASRQPMHWDNHWRVWPAV